MKIKNKSMYLILIVLMYCGGCNILDNVGGWNLSACQDNFDVCFELYWDNSDKINASFITALNGE